MKTTTRNTKEKIWRALVEPAELVHHPDYGDLVDYDVFVSMCKGGMFIDYDGSGSWATTTRYLPGWGDVNPSTVCKVEKPGWATHVL